MANFEENLARLESLTQDIKRSDISLEEALRDFEEGVKLAKSLEKEIDRIEGKIQILMNQPSREANPHAELDLFSGVDSDGTSGVPEAGLRQ